MFSSYKNKIMLNCDFYKENKEYELKDEIVKFENKYYRLFKNDKRGDCQECKEKFGCFNGTYGYWFFVDKKNKLYLDDCNLKSRYNFEEVNLNQKELLELKITNSIKELELVLVVEKKENEELVND